MICNCSVLTTTLRAIIFTLVYSITLSGCDQADDKFKSYSVGFSTPNVKVWVSEATLDNRIRLSAGSIQGEWEEESATNAIFNEPMPHEIYVRWEEDKSGIRYEATVKLVGDLASRVRRLPPVTYITTNDKNVGTIDLIIGLAPSGTVTVWLSNYPYSQQSIIGRYLEIIGVAQGRSSNK